MKKQDSPVYGALLVWLSGIQMPHSLNYFYVLFLCLVKWKFFMLSYVILINHICKEWTSSLCLQGSWRRDSLLRGRGVILLGAAPPEAAITWLSVPCPHLAQLIADAGTEALGKSGVCSGSKSQTTEKKDWGDVLWPPGLWLCGVVLLSVLNLTPGDSQGGPERCRLLSH